LSDPYSYTQSDQGVYIFTTINGISYNVLIADYSDTFGIFEGNCRMIFLALYPIGEPDHIPFDRRVGDTTSQIIIDFLKKNRDIVLYVCSSVNNQELTRANLFDRWFRKNNEGDLMRQIKFIEGNMHYFIFHEKNTRAIEIMNDIDSYLLL
jgi:hypothetical protein